MTTCRRFFGIIAGRGWYINFAMNKPDIAKHLARQSKSSLGAAADRLDRMVSEVVRKLKHGQEARLPGVGAFTRSRDGKIAFEPERKGHE